MLHAHGIEGIASRTTTDRIFSILSDLYKIEIFRIFFFKILLSNFTLKSQEPKIFLALTSLF